jgi:transposase
MTLHLAEISLAVKEGAHAIVILDQAGWHGAKDLQVPGNITLLPLPPRSPELNPVENIWQFMRDNWLSNRVFKSYEDILDHCCFAWNQLTQQALEDHVHRTARLGPCMINFRIWYNWGILFLHPATNRNDGHCDAVKREATEGFPW